MALPFVLDTSAKLILGGSAASLAAAGGYSVYNWRRNHRYGLMLESKETIKQHVKHELRLGRNLKTIKKNLINANHNEKLVKEVVSSLELYHYVYHNMKKGHQATQLKNALLHWGWGSEQVNEAVIHASHRIVEQNSPAKKFTV
ncbi:MAG: hypothetical protein QF475_02260 [Candidatus Undinarchaeales archaeon]|nr:hypothetical protein [Candidatus Undinarchaeales archaeon]